MPTNWCSPRPCSRCSVAFAPVSWSWCGRCCDSCCRVRSCFWKTKGVMKVNWEKLVNLLNNFAKLLLQDHSLPARLEEDQTIGDRKAGQEQHEQQKKIVEVVVSGRLEHRLVRYVRGQDGPGFEVHHDVQLHRVDYGQSWRERAKAKSFRYQIFRFKKFRIEPGR